MRRYLIKLNKIFNYLQPLKLNAKVYLKRHTVYEEHICLKPVEFDCLVQLTDLFSSKFDKRRNLVAVKPTHGYKQFNALRKAFIKIWCI